MTSTDTATTPPPAGTIRIWSDLLCPFAHVLLHTWRQARADDPALRKVSIEHRAFPRLAVVPLSCYDRFHN